jgi:DNA-binding CsgD family transcriptional regulator
MPTLQGSLRRIERICASSSDSRQLRAEILDALCRVIDFDAWVWVVTDPVTTVGVSPVAHVPSFANLPTTIRLKYLSGINRWTGLVDSRRTVGLLSRASGTPSSSSLVWRRFLENYGIQDVASVVFFDRFGTWGFLDLWRAGPHRFTDGEAAALSALPAMLTEALRSRIAATFDVPARPPGRELGPVVAILDDDLHVVSQTPASDTWLQKLLPAESGHPPVPASVYNVAAQLLAVEQGADAHPAAASAHLSEGLWVTLRAARLRAASRADRSDGAIVVTIEEASAEARGEVFGRAFGLSRREREVLALLGGGAETRELARQLSISHFTVQDHLKSIFVKTGAPTRQVLVARATGR